MKLLSMVILGTAFWACGSNSKNSSSDPNVVVNPDDLRGWIQVSLPENVTMPAWSPTKNVIYGKKSDLKYDSDHYHVYSSEVKLATLPLGTAYYAPEGIYTVVLNDTWFSAPIKKAQTLIINSEPIEVMDVEGLYSIDAKQGDFSNGGTLFDSEMPTGVGVAVFPGNYSVSVKYQNHTKTFEVSIPANIRYVE